jgi:hypothetical protein
MAIPKKGSRKITVNNTEYRWNIRRKPSHCQADFALNVTVSAELYEMSGSVLVIEFSWNQYQYSDKTEFPVTPKLIEQSISSAISKGWKPEKKGSQFNYVHDKKPT